MRADAQRNRQRILTTAKELFERDGVSVPLDDIARAAGVGPGTLHRHFPSKEVLLAEVVVDRVTSLADQLSALAGEDQPGDALTDAVSLMLDEGDRSASLKAALTGTDFDLRRAAPDATARLNTAVDQLLQQAQRARQIRDDIDINDLMALIAGAFTAEQHVDPNRRRPPRLAAVLFDGLRTTTTTTED